MSISSRDREPGVRGENEFEDHDPPLPRRTYDRTPYCSHVLYIHTTGIPKFGVGSWNWKVLLEKLLPT